MKGLRALWYSFALRCDKLDMVDVACVKELLSRQVKQPFQGLDLSPSTCPSLDAVLCIPVRTYLLLMVRPGI